MENRHKELDIRFDRRQGNDFCVAAWEAGAPDLFILDNKDGAYSVCWLGEGGVDNYDDATWNGLYYVALAATAKEAIALAGYLADRLYEAEALGREP